MATREYLKENVGEGELEIYRTFNAGVASAYNNGFSTLVLPHAIDIDVEQHTLRMPFYEGETFNDVWDVENGGAGMDMSLTSTIPLLLKDLSTIDPSIFTVDEYLLQIPNLVFSHNSVARYFGGLSVAFTQEGILSDKEHAKVVQLLGHNQTTKAIISNGDFYARNFIRRSDGKIVLIDWETWNDHSPFFIVDHPENVAAVQYVHMWGNPEWRVAFRTELDRYFSFSPKSFDKGVLIKTLTLASFFRKHQTLFDGQITMLKQLLADY